MQQSSRKQARRASTAPVARAAFLLFAALLGATRANASLTKAADVAALSRPALQLPTVVPTESSRFSFAEDLYLLNVENEEPRFSLIEGVETRRFERTYAGNNPLKYVDPNGQETVTVLPEVQEKMSSAGHEARANFAFAAFTAVAVTPMLAAIAGETLTLLAPTVMTLAERARDIQNALTSPVTRDRVTTAVATVEQVTGEIGIRVASSEKVLRPAQIQALRAGEQAVRGLGHAEATIINNAKAAGEIVKEVAASRRICPTCAQLIRDVGAKAVTPLKVRFPEELAQ